ncbi:MAG: flagellar assembly protein FliW [Treponema sp.]|nr:MAG: flagellar assembly protein FliW [Treponema sp.]
MNIETKTMGTVEITDEQKIYLPEGFYGFEEYHEFALLDSEQKPFFWIQSLEDPNLAFIVIDPFLFRPDYEVDIDDKSLKPIDADSPDSLIIFALVTIPADGSAITANLQGPLIINKKNKKAMQAVTGDSKWGTKHNIVEEMKEFASKEGSR